MGENESSTLINPLSPLIATMQINLLSGGHQSTVLIDLFSML